MLEVNLTGALRSAANGADKIEIEARSIRELLTRIGAQYPLMRQHLETGIAVSIDGNIYRDNWATAIPPNAEVFLIARIQGG